MRHACLALAAHRARRPRPDLVADDDGFLYSPAFRRAAAGMLPPDHLAAVEAALALAGAAAALDPLIQALRRNGDVSPPALSRTFTDITPERATDVRDTCCHLAERQ